MTQLFPFVPNTQSPFTFQPTLDGLPYAASVTWNLMGQRWYLNITQLNGTPILTQANIGSPDGVAIQSIDWAHGVVTVVTALPHQYTVGQVIDVTISGCLPDAYNGLVEAFIVDKVTFTYQLAMDPGDATQLGNEMYNINLIENYFDASTLVFRQSSQTCEVTP